MTSELITESAITKDGKPFIVIRWGQENGQVDTATARAMGVHFLAAADAAESDAALVKVLRERGEPDNVVVGMLSDMRVVRGLSPGRQEDAA